LKRQQAEWAERRGVPMTRRRGYADALGANLFVGLSEPTRRAFEAGHGKELEGKMRAPHSSSALAVNVFEYWNQAADRAPLAEALGLTSPIVRVIFEAQKPTGLQGTPPNLDVLLELADGSVVAIESKFLEPYGAHDAGFNPKYFERQPGLWAQHGFRACEALAEEIRDGVTTYHWLYAQQLLKHVLGLAESEVRPWALYYLWYAVSGPESAMHAAEAEDFAQRVTADGIRFRSMTYQQLFEGLEHSATKADARYLEYLDGRYFDQRKPWE
jgi:hypothetical protein